MDQYIYYVPGHMPDYVPKDLENLERLVSDLRRYAAGHAPDAWQLSASPLVEQWATIADPSGLRIVGFVSRHPKVGPGPGITSRVYAVDHCHRWIRTYSRLWRLGIPRKAETVDRVTY